MNKYNKFIYIFIIFFSGCTGIDIKSYQFYKNNVVVQSFENYKVGIDTLFATAPPSISNFLKSLEENLYTNLKNNRNVADIYKYNFNNFQNFDLNEYNNFIAKNNIKLSLDVFLFEYKIIKNEIIFIILKIELFDIENRKVVWSRQINIDLFISIDELIDEDISKKYTIKILKLLERDSLI